MTAIGWHLRFVVPQVVCADEDDNRFWLHGRLQFAIPQPPQQVARLVACADRFPDQTQPKAVALHMVCKVARLMIWDLSQVLRRLSQQDICSYKISSSTFLGGQNAAEERTSYGQAQGFVLAKCLPPHCTRLAAINGQILVTPASLQSQAKLVKASYHVQLYAQLTLHSRRQSD